MTELLRDHIALWLILAWPLLVALPGVYRRLPQPWLLALAPAALLLVTVGTAGLDMPWIVFGSGLELDGGRRWLLGMTLLLWLAAGRCAAQYDPAWRPGLHTLLLITFSGQTGMILASEPVGFLCFATLLSYGFYGLLVYGAGADARRAARFYIAVLILADLLLFEALLLAAYLQGTARFTGFDFQLQGDTAGLYTALVLTAFLLKAGAWPVHPWITAALRTAPAPARLLLAGGPVVMALLGLWRWLPPGPGLELAGQVCRGLGTLALIHALVQWRRRPAPDYRPGWLLMALTGALLLGFGQALLEPDLHGQLQTLAAPLLALLGLLPALLLWYRSSLMHTGSLGGEAPWRWRNRLQCPLQCAHRYLLRTVQGLQHPPRLDANAPARLATNIENHIARWPWVIMALALLGLVLGLLT